MEYYIYPRAVSPHGGESLRRTWIVVAGVLALGATLALAMFGVAPDGGHTWVYAIKTAVCKVSATGGHTWIY